VAVGGHENHLWRLDAVQGLMADDTHPVTYLCGGSRNHADLVDLLDGVVVLALIVDTLRRPLDERPAGEFGSEPDERALVLRVHGTGEDLPDGIRVDATRPLTDVVDEVLRVTGQPSS
jgi:hypothetical protein